MALLTDRKFIHFNRKSDFEALLNANAISDKQIVFLKDAQEIWTHGTYYGSVEQFLDETNKDSTNAISAAAVYKALTDDEKTIAAALNDLNDRIENIDIPSKVSDLTDDLSLATLDYVDDKLDDVLGISADGVEAFVNMTKDEDTATGILTEIVNKAPKTNAVNGAPLSNAESYFYGTSTTAAATVLKEVSIPSITSLKTGQIIVVKPTITSTVANSTIKLNNFTAYPMRYNNAAITTSTDSIVWEANIPSIWVFDGTYWVFLGHGLDSNTTYSAMTQAEATTGTATTARTISAKVLHDTIAESIPIKSVAVNGTALTPDANKAVDITVPTESTVTGWGFTKLFVVHTDSEFPTTDGTYNITVDYTGNEITAAYNRGEYPILEFQDKAATLPIIGLNDIVNFGTTVNKISLLVGIPSDSTNANLIVAHCIGPEEISHQSIKFLNTTNTSAQHVNESETIAGSGTINLHKVSKTGSYSDLIKPSTGIPKTDLASAVQTSLGKADAAIQGVKVNSTALTPDSNKVVDVTIPTNVSDLTNDLNFVRRYNLLDQSVLLLGDENQWYENSELNTPEIVFKLNQTHDNILLGEFYPTLIYSRLPHVSGSDFYPNTALGLISYITANLGEFSGYYNRSSTKPNWRTGWGAIPTVDLAFDNGNEDVNIIPGISMTFVGVEDRGAIGQGTHYITICYNSIYRNYNFGLKIFYDLELQRLRSPNPFVLTISDLGEVNTIETIKVNNIALTPDANKAVNITIPEGELSNNYEPSSLDNEDLELAAGDTYEEAFGKLEKSINDNEQITAAALTDLDSRINTLHLPQSLDDIPDGSTRKLSDYATTTLLATKQDTLVSGTNIKTINNQSLLGSGNITIQGGSGGDTNVIETVKVNGTALTPDANKAVNITSIPANIVTQDSTHRFVSDTEKTTWNNKVSNVQADWNATSGLAQILNKPTIPAAVTESTVSGWGFTKNTGTVTRVKINGTTKNPTSGVVDLGTVLTSFTETDPTVPAWAKAASKPTYTAAEVGALPDTYTPPVTSVNGQTGAVNLTIPAAPGTLNTTATTAQSTSSSEALSGNITLHKVAKTGTYNDLIGKPTIPTVNNATLTIQKNGTTVSTFTANASSNVTANIQVNELPTVSSSDNGKILQVVNGAWALVTPTAIYSGTSAPDNTQGNNGDLYLQTS